MKSLGCVAPESGVGETADDEERTGSDMTTQNKPCGARPRENAPPDPAESPSLARFQRVLAILENVLRGGPRRLLDIGSGRGAFLKRLLRAFPELHVTAVDVDVERVRGLPNVERLTGRVMDAGTLELDPRSFDVVTALEVLEHLERPERAACEALRVTRHSVVASVPSKPDANPDHLRLFTPESLSDLFRSAGASDVTIEVIPNHLIAIARV